MNAQLTRYVRSRVTAAALAGLGLLFSGSIARPQSEVVTTGDAATQVGETVNDSVSRAMRQAELAISRAADVGKSVAIRLTAGDAPSALVLPREDMDAEETERLVEDLGVMRRIWDKAIRRAPDRAERMWLGGMLGGSSGRKPDALYLDGFGALFLLRVDFPLVGPATAPKEKQAEATDREWEEARRELREGVSGDVRIWDTVTVHALRTGWVEYDEDRVKAMRAALVEAFKHAANLGALKADETVAVTVFGPGAAVDGEPSAKAANRPGRSEPVPDGGKVGSMLTLRAKKSEVDAFAKGKLTVEEFGKKVRETLR